MKFQGARQLNINDLNSKTIDLFIVASGYESRCVKLARDIKAEILQSVVISFEERKEHPQRKENDSFFISKGFKFYQAKEGDCSEIITILDDVLQSFSQEGSFNILIDYSCMTKVWYATMINYFVHRESNLSNVRLLFSYSPSDFCEPKVPMPNKYMGPIPGIYRISTSNKPTALIIGLGYEKDRANGLSEYLDPKVTFAFYANPALDSRFVKTVEENNAEFLAALGPEHVMQYPMYDLKAADAYLTSLCLGLKNKFRIILAPLGPKPFALLCLLISARYQDIDVWRVSAGDSGNIYDRGPIDTEPIVCEAIFEMEREVISLT